MYGSTGGPVLASVGLPIIFGTIRAGLICPHPRENLHISCLFTSHQMQGLPLWTITCKHGSYPRVERYEVRKNELKLNDKGLQ